MLFLSFIYLLMVNFGKMYRNKYILRTNYLFINIIFSHFNRILNNIAALFQESKTNYNKTSTTN